MILRHFTYLGQRALKKVLLVLSGHVAVRVPASPIVVPCARSYAEKLCSPFGREVEGFLPFDRCLAIALSVLLLCPPAGAAQTADPAPVPDRGKLNLYVLEGQNAVNSLADRTITHPVVEVRDANDHPVEGADVTFELPAAGPGGVFNNQQKVFKTKTTLSGQATAILIPDAQPGKYTIRVTATYRNQSGETSITQTNAAESTAVLEARKNRSFWSKWKWYLIAAAAAGVAGGVVLGTRNGNTAAASPPITIGTGPITIGGPR